MPVVGACRMPLRTALCFAGLLVCCVCTDDHFRSEVDKLLRRDTWGDAETADLQKIADDYKAKFAQMLRTAVLDHRSRLNYPTRPLSSPEQVIFDVAQHSVPQDFSIVLDHAALYRRVGDREQCDNVLQKASAQHLALVSSALRSNFCEPESASEPTSPVTLTVPTPGNNDGGHAVWQNIQNRQKGHDMSVDSQWSYLSRLEALGATDTYGKRTGANAHELPLLAHRAYVGPPSRFAKMGAMQFTLLSLLGIDEQDYILELGCGSLRAGRFLMTFLTKGRYHCIEPNAELVELGLEHEIGRDIARLKAPRFDTNTVFDYSVFGQKFDWILGQSIFSHTGPGLVAQALNSTRRNLSPNGVVLITFHPPTAEAGPPTADDEWRYPGCIGYEDETVRAMLAASGLFYAQLPWYIPSSQKFWVVAHNRERVVEMLTRRSSCVDKNLW